MHIVAAVPPSTALQLVDLDQRPDLQPAVLQLFDACSPGAHHLVCGIAAHMGLKPTVETLQKVAGVLIAMHANHPVGTLAICPYSDEQVTLWGPALLHGVASKVGDVLIDAARGALQLSRYGSMRTLVDRRNREARAQLQAHGFSAWKDNLLFERRLESSLAAQPTRVRLASSRDLSRTATLFIQGFPESDHCVPNLERREVEGFWHYVLEHQGKLVAAAALQNANNRAWMKLITVDSSQRGKGFGRALLEGICIEEAKRYTQTLAFEVLSDNNIATHLYEDLGFKRRFTATVMTAPI
jgi:ribosomal protein S18 acetylase RimI-like enzyme